MNDRSFIVNPQLKRVSRDYLAFTLMPSRIRQTNLG
jgi:hypothetical protein